MFHIDERTGMIRLINGSIHLTKHKYELNVTAKDDGSCCKNGTQTIHTITALVVVFIRDSNENKPIFNDWTRFAIDEITGEIKTNKVFDRGGDDGQIVSLTVKAVDTGAPPLEGSINKNIKQDTVIETNILHVSAFDMITYNLTTSGDLSDLEYFVINPLTKGQFHLIVVAMDNGVHQQSSYAGVFINAIEKTNNPPVWEQPVYGLISIKENIEVGRRVISIKASSGIPDDAAVFYTLIIGSTEQTNLRDTFYLSRTTDNVETYADIYVNYPLDYESTQQFNLTVRVENNGIQKLAAEATVFIIVEDVNDETSIFDNKEHATVLEGMPPATFVTKVEAVDQDGTYPNNKSFTIEVKPYDGAPSSRPKTNVTEMNSVTRNFTIEIGDKNDNYPHFDYSLYEAEVNEDVDIH
ncbi:Pt1-cadherin-like protein, partial [Leptotrombidium deliense]